ncbi:MAG TPA: hypothetical protein DDY31_11145 [Lachnospiraceae bacterium]|nr:hypothetical protein [Lachnospiraceae bacterium]
MSKTQKQEEKILEKFEKTKDDKKQKKRRKRKNAASLLAILLLTFCSIAAIFEKNAFIANAASTDAKVDNGWYAVTSEDSLTAQYKKPSKKDCTWANIPNTVKIGNKEYKVANIAPNAFKGYSKLKKVTIGKNVGEIGKKAFYGCKSLKAITIQTTKLTKASIGSKAFSNINVKAVVIVPQSKLAKYKAILKKKGLNGKGQKVECENTPFISDPDSPLPDPECLFYSIGDLSEAGTETYKGRLKTDSKSYTIDEKIPFTTKVWLQPGIYGKLEVKETTGTYDRCLACGRTFPNMRMLAIHEAVLKCNSAHYVFGSQDEPFDAYYWIPDPEPCKVVYHYTIPEGLSYKKESVRVVHHKKGNIDSKYYHVDFSGQDLTVTIDDIKAEPYYTMDWNEEMRYIRSGIAVTFDTEMNGRIAMDNTASASITYSYKGKEKAIDLGETTIHTASIKIKNIDQNGDNVAGAKFDLYQERTIYPEGSNLGVVKYVKIAEGVSAGDVIYGVGERTGRLEDYLKVVQSSVPDGYEEAYDKEFDLSINAGSSWTTVMAEDTMGNQLPVDGNVVTVTVVNEK